MRVDDIRKEIQRARGAVLRILRAGRAELSADIALAIESLDAAEHQLEQFAAQELPARARDRVAKAYRVEGRRRGEFLAEYREGDLVPFRVPRHSYDAIARVMPKFHDFVKYAEIASAVRQQLGEALPDYQIRTVLRFWSECGAVEKSRARFRVLDPKKWAKNVERAWADARASG